MNGLRPHAEKWPARRTRVALRHGGASSPGSTGAYGSKVASACTGRDARAGAGGGADVLAEAATTSAVRSAPRVSIRAPPNVAERRRSSGVGKGVGSLDGSWVGNGVVGVGADNANSICNGAFTTWQFTVYMGQGVTGCNAGSNGIEKVFTAGSGSCDSQAFTFDLIIPDHPTVTGRFTMKMAFNVDCVAAGASTAPFSSAVTALKSSAEPDVMKKSSSSSSTCFPASASAQMADGSTKLFSALQVGDSILTGKAKFSEVHMFSHHYPEAVNPFVQLTTAAGQELRLTAGHYLYVNGSLAKASSVHVGDTLEDAAGAPAVVVKTAVVKDTGLYNPHTLDGDVVVNGIRTSTYTDAIHPTMAHALLAPIRALYSMGKAFEL